MNKKKIHFVTDKTNTAILYRKKFYKIHKNSSIRSSDIIVVLGGDGFMLETLKKYQKYNKPFYGINMGTFGFLMNKFKNIDLYKIFSKAKLVSISPLEAKVTNVKKKNYKGFCN